MGALGFALQVFDLVPFVIKGVTGAIDAFTAGRDAVKAMTNENRDPTQAEWDALNAATDKLRTALHSDET